MLCHAAGGYLGVNLAAKHPEVVKGLILLNATPFWSQRPPPGQGGLLWQTLLKDLDAVVPVSHVSVRECVRKRESDQVRAICVRLRRDDVI